MKNLSVVARRFEPTDSLDYFPTPPWATRAFLSHMERWIDPDDSICEPACGEGHMAAVLAERGNPISASDIFDYGYGRVEDFLASNAPLPSGPCVDWVITNPPFKAAKDFAWTALNRARKGVCLLVRLQWLESGERHFLFNKTSPNLVLVYSGRVPMHKGRWEPDGVTATAYCWVCWINGQSARPCVIDWIRPDAKQVFSRPDDAVRFGAKREGALL